MKFTPSRRAAAVGTLIGIFMGVGGAASFAAVAHGTERYYSQSGENYISRASINSTSDVSTGYVRTNGTGNASAGWMGVQSRSFRSNGVMCSQSQMTYNAGAWSGLSVSASAKCGAGNYYGGGSTQAWHGSGYYSYVMNISPLLYVS